MKRYSVRRSIRVLAFFLAAAMLTLALAQARPGTDQQQRAVFQQRYAAMKSAMASRDPKAIAALLASDFESVDVSGATQTADQMIQQVVALPHDANKKSETTILSIASDKSKAIVVQRYHMATTKGVPDSAQMRAIDLVATSTDTWLLINGTWLMKRTVTEKFDYSVDGKLVAHNERARQK